MSIDYQTLAKIACDSTADREQRLLAVETITAARWRIRTHHQSRLVGEEKCQTPLPPGDVDEILRRETIEKYALLLLQQDNPPLIIDEILRRVHARYPVVTEPGPHQGRPTRLGRQRLYDIRDIAQQRGMRFPLRPRSPLKRRVAGKLAATEEPDAFARRCAHCGASFAATGSRTFCSTDCATEARRHQQAAAYRRRARNHAAGGIA